MTAYGYARVSTFDQDLTIQQQALHATGCSVVRAEKASGSRRDGRTELQVLLGFVQPGDVLVVTRIDRLARSLKNLQDIVHELKGRSVARRARRPSTCWACSPSSRPTCGANANSMASLRPRRAGSTRDASPPSTPPRSGACGTRRSWDQPSSRAGSASVGPASTAHSASGIESCPLAPPGN